LTHPFQKRKVFQQETGVDIRLWGSPARFAPMTGIVEGVAFQKENIRKLIGYGAPDLFQNQG
jgi:hypothetical protein